MSELDASEWRTRRTVLAAGVGAVSTGLSGCLGGTLASSNPDEDDGISAVAGSFFVLFDLSRWIAGDALTVEDLVPIGAHGDDWEPPAGIIREVAESDVFVYIDGFRSWSDRVAANIQTDHPEMVVINAADGIEYIEGEQGRALDPHFWLDPIRTKQAVATIRDGFIAADPANATVYETNATALSDRIDGVHDEFSRAMANRRQDQIVVASHNSFAYWEPRYGIDIHSPVGISPDADPTPGELRDTLDLIERNGISTVLYDMYEATNLVEMVAEETGAEMWPLSPIEATTEEQLAAGMGYVEHMREINLPSLEEALDVHE